MEKNYIKSIKRIAHVTKVQKGLLSLHPTLSKIYTYSDKNAIEDLAQTMRELGQLEPLIVNSKLQILSGGRRLMASLLIDELQELDVIIKNDGGIDAALTIVCHNQQREKTPREILNEAEIILAILGKRQGRRNDLKKDEVSNPFGVKGKDRFEIAANVVGKSASTIRNYIDILNFERESEENKTLGVLDKVLDEGLAPSRAKKIIKDYEEAKFIRDSMKSITMPSFFTTKDVSIYNKSCIDMSEIDTGSVQVVFTSPVYYNQRNYGNSVEGTPELGQETSPDKYVSNIINHLKEVKRVLKETGSFFLNIGETYKDRQALLIPTKLLLALCKEEGWCLVNKIIWKKTNAIPQSLTKRLQPTYEEILHLVKNPDRYYYEECKVWNNNQMEISKGPADRNTKQTGAKESGFMLSRPYRKFKDFLSKHEFHDVIIGNNASMRQKELKELDGTADHPALMPTYLPVIPILSTSKPGDVVLDPFSGSATTGQVAVLLGRKYIGYEVNEKNFQLSKLDIDKTISERSTPCMEEVFQMAA